MLNETRKYSEPWQITRNEFKNILPPPKQIKEGLWRVEYAGESRPFTSLLDAQENAANKFHRVFVREAIEDGKPIPNEVLKDYPEWRTI